MHFNLNIIGTISTGVNKNYGCLYHRKICLDLPVTFLINIDKADISCKIWEPQSIIGVSAYLTKVPIHADCGRKAE